MKDQWEILDYVQAGMLARHKGWRAGQGLYNALALVLPEIFKEVNGNPNLDPLWDNEKIIPCLKFIKSKLEKGE